VATFIGGEKILPLANMAKKEISDGFKDPHTVTPAVAAKKKTAAVVREFRRNFCYFGNKNTMYQFQEFGTLPQTARGIWRETFDSSFITKRIQAENMVYDSTGWRFIKGSVRTFSADGVTTKPFDTLRDSILTVSPLTMVARIKDKEEMSYWELKSFIDAAERRGEQVQKYMGELDFKLALPFMNFIVILLGIAITARAGRKGSVTLFAVGLAMAFTFWIISRFALAFAQNGLFPTMVGAWLGNVIFFLLGLVLFRRASR
jgi:lipopolysaccharide export system permease protein